MQATGIPQVQRAANQEQEADRSRAAGTLWLAPVSSCGQREQVAVATGMPLSSEPTDPLALLCKFRLGGSSAS